jgi:hypothetical protein
MRQEISATRASWWGQVVNGRISMPLTS